MRKAFTLLELLVIIVIILVMTGVAVVTIATGEEASRLKGGTRDVLATVRLARLTALASEQACIVTLVTEKTENGTQSKVILHAPDLKKPCMGLQARTLAGDPVMIGEPVEESATGSSDTEIRFVQVDEEVLENICLKVVMDEEEPPPGIDENADEAKRSMISFFSNTDFLLGKFRQQRESDLEKEGKSVPAPAAPVAQRDTWEEAEDKSLVWQANGRCEPHRIYVYAHGDKPSDGWVIRVDRYGNAKMQEDGEDR